MRQSLMIWTACLFVLIFSTTIQAEWPASADANLVICNHSGEQSITKVAAASDGGCYISWFDHQSGNYDVYLQRLNGDGIPQWQDNGILISNHPQNSWITDYDLTVDQEDHAIVVFNDIRSGPDWDIYAYRISPAGEFVWGANGLTVSDNTNFEPSPKVAVTSEGHIIITWTEETGMGTVINLRKLTTAGEDCWSPPMVTFTAGYGVTNPWITAADADNVILLYLKATGPDYWDPQHLLAQKYDSSGSALWNPDGVTVSTAGGIALYMTPEIQHDGYGGAFAYWYDTRAMDHHVYVQRILEDGTTAWTTNGVRTVTIGGELQMDPTLVCSADSGSVMVFYLATDMNQNDRGVHGQMLNSEGELQWGSGGSALIPLSSNNPSAIHAYPQDNGAVVIYKQDVPGSVVNTQIKAFRTDENGGHVWDSSPVIMCSVISGKGRIAGDCNYLGQLIAAWSDDRFDASGDIYLQNINPDGTLGDYLPNFPPMIEITSPPDSSETESLPVEITFLVENFVVAGTEGDGVIAVRVNDITIEWHDSEASVMVEFLEEGANTIILELVDYSHQSLDPPAMDLIYVFYSVPVPAIDITSPADQTEIETLPLTVEFTVDNFMVAPEGGDGEVELRVNGVIVDWYTSDDPLSIASLEEGENLIELELVDYDHQPLDPQALDSVHVTYTPSSAKADQIMNPGTYALFQNYPNPFNATTQFLFRLPKTGHASISIFDISGRLTAVAADGIYSAGEHTVSFDAGRLPSGLYFFRLTAGGFSETGKMILMK